MKKIIRALVAILFIFLPIIFNPFGFDVFALPRVLFLYLISLTLLAVIIFDLAKQKSIRFKYTSLHIPLLLFTGFIILSAIFSLSKYTSIWGFQWDYEGLISWFCYLLLFYIGFLFFRKDEYYRSLSKLLALAIIAVGIYAVLEYYWGFSIMDWVQQMEVKRSASFLGHPSYLGAYILLYLPFVFFLAFDKLTAYYWRMVAIFASVIGLVSLVLSFSRGAWLAFVAALCLFIIVNIGNLIRHVRKHKLQFFVVFTIFIVLMIAIASLPIGRSLSSRFTSIFDRETQTRTVRSYLFEQSINLLKDNYLLGIGPDNFAYRIPKYFLPQWEAFEDTVANKAHNHFVDYWISFGLGGIISYLVFLIAWFVFLIKTLKKKINYYLEAILFSVIGYIGAVQFHYTTIDLAPFFWFILGSSIGMMVRAGGLREHVIELQRKESILKWFKYQVYVVMFILFVIFAYFGYMRISADIYFAKSQKIADNISRKIDYLEIANHRCPRINNYYFALYNEYLKKGHLDDNYLYFDKAINLLKDSKKLNPFDYYLSYQLGETYLRIIGFSQNKMYVYNEAKKAYLETIRLYPNHVDSYIKLGVIEAGLGDSQEAVKYWTKCLEINSNEKKCYYNLYVEYDKIGDQEKSRYYFNHFQN